MRHHFHRQNAVHAQAERDGFMGRGRGPRHGQGHGPHHGPHGHGRGEGEGPGWGGGRRRRGMLDAEELRLVLLSLLNDQPSHGYDLIRAIEELTGGAYAPSPGVVYPALSLLRDMSQVEEVDSEGTRKAFVPTDAGREALAANAAPLTAALERLKALAAETARVDPTPVRRAMDNLRTVLKHRLSREDATRDTALDLAARLDALAQDLERG